MPLRKGAVAIGQKLSSSKPHAFQFVLLDRILPRQEQARRPSRPEKWALDPKSNTELKAKGRGLTQRQTSKKPDKAIFSKPQKTINSRQHSQFSQDVCCSHHRRSCASSELSKLTSPMARSRVSAKIKIVKKVVQWTSFVILLIVTASLCPDLLPGDKG